MNRCSLLPPLLWLFKGAEAAKRERTKATSFVFGCRPHRWKGKSMLQSVNHRRPLAVFLSVLLIALLGGVGESSLAQTGPTGRRSVALDVYALRGLQDQSAKLYLSILPSGQEANPPEQLALVQVKVDSAAGHHQSTNNYMNVYAPGGQAVIDLGDVPLLDSVSVRVLVRTTQSPSTEMLTGTTAVTEFAVNSHKIVVPDFEGYGAQLNQNLYTSLSNSASNWNNNPPEDTANVEAKVKSMRPGLSRIFISKDSFLSGNQSLLDSFDRTVELAQSAGARVNVTWQSLTHPSNNLTTAQTEAYIDTDMQHFAMAVNDLVKNNGITAIKELTVQNEPDSAAYITKNMILYEYAYRQLDSYLRQYGIRNQIKLIGGDLVLNGQGPFFYYMAEHMDDVLDGWSEHIYWNYYDPGYMNTRLDGILAEMTALKNDGYSTKPLSITEYGVRGYKTYNGVALKDQDPYKNNALVATAAGSYVNPDGTLTPISQTNIAAFQQAQFNMQGVNDGFIGFSKWDSYRAQYDFGYQDYSLIGYIANPTADQDQWPLRPSYNMEWLMANTTGQHWQVVGYEGVSGAKLITPFRDPRGNLTLFSMSTDQAAASFSVGDLPPWRAFKVLTWNADGTGGVTNGGIINSGVTGTVHFSAPAESMVVLTAVPGVGAELCGHRVGPCDLAARSRESAHRWNKWN